MHQVMDRESAEHFYAWLEKTVPPHLQHEVEQGVHEILRADPDLLLTHSWPEIGRMANVW